ncbi:MAG: ABC transporter permease subunit [Tuberibacillus sp.]
MLRFFWGLLGTIALTAICCFLVGEMPYFFFDISKMTVNPLTNEFGAVVSVSYLANLEPSGLAYAKHLIPSLQEILHPGQMHYYLLDKSEPLFPTVMVKYFYSMKILMGALLCAFFISVVLTMLILMLPPWARKIIKAAMNAIQAIPDIFYLLLFIVLIITFYEKTHILVFDIAEYDKKIYGLPILILSFIPVIQIMQYLIVDMEDELSEPYVELASSKGFSKGRILVVHVLRNALVTFLAQLKTIFWFALTNLIMVEILLNMNGLMSFLFFYGLKTPEVIVISLSMVVLPFVILFYLGKWLSERLRANSGGVTE